MPTYFTPEEVEAILKLPKGKASRLAKRGKLPAVILPDGSVRFDAGKLTAFLNQNEVGQNPPAGSAVQP